ncbi:MAG: VOC family protein [Alphaproteobacteria bacterium]|nr:VOC family protein [Alphaproteobacteria bacterium]
MAAPSFLILYVKNLHKSIEFYKRVLGMSPADQAPGFAMFVLPNGLKFALWLAGTVDPEVETGGGGAEYGIALPAKSDLAASYDAARADALNVIQPPTEMAFGLTYVVEDPDRHRIRYYVPAA